MKISMRLAGRFAVSVGTIFFLAFPCFAQVQQLVPAMEYPIFSWTNLARQYYGLAPLRYNPTLALAAQRHALNMAAQETMSHTLDGMTMVERVNMLGYSYAALGENVAYNFGYANPDWKLFEGWMNSPGHFRNIVHVQFTEIGVGVARSASGKIYACQVFGHPSALPPPYRTLSPYYGASRSWSPPQESSFYYYEGGFPE